MATNPPLGFIVPAVRTQDQHDQHALAVAKMVLHHGLPCPTLAKGAKVVLTDSWNHPDVISDVGRRFIRELQLSGSCVKVGGTNALRCTIGTQRLVADAPIKAFEPFTWHNYAMSRHAYGDDGQGEGSLGSTFAKSLEVDGVRDWPQDSGDTLPDYVFEGDHIRIARSQELEWSSYYNPKLQAVLAQARPHVLGKAGVCRAAQDVKAMILNGYGVAWACNNYIGNGTIRGGGSDAYVSGYWDNSGGHQQWVFGYWEHPTDGPLYAVGNNWGDNTYPKDPAGLPLCCVWVSESRLESALRNLDAEVFGYSSLNWFPAQPRTLDWFIAP